MQALVSLTNTTPARGTAVSLQSTDPAVIVPSSITVTAGATSVTFPINTTAVTTLTAASVVAALGGVTCTVNVQVNPATPPDVVTVSNAT